MIASSDNGFVSGGSPSGDPEAGHLFIAMAYYAGETIREKIVRGPLPIGEALDYACQAADGLARAHEAGIVHRDIKPANVIVTDRSEVKIVDFGLAKSAGSEPSREGATPGTVAYMSPEQTLGGPVDHRTDIWSLGALLYEMLTGRQPFPGDHDAVVIHAIRHDEPEPVGRVRADVPDAVAHVVRTCLAKDPADRYQRTADLVATLKANASVRPDAQPAAGRPEHPSASVRRLRAARGVGTGRVGLLLGLIGLTAAASYLGNCQRGARRCRPRHWGDVGSGAARRQNILRCRQQPDVVHRNPSPGPPGTEVGMTPSLRHSSSSAKFSAISSSGWRI